MQATEGATLEFTLDNIPYSTEYHLLIRYEATGNREWREVGIDLQRPPNEDPSGTCGNEIRQQGYIFTTLPSGQRYQFVNPPICLERGQVYTLKLDFARQGDAGTPSPTAILIDSVSQVPVVTGMASCYSSRKHVIITCFECIEQLSFLRLSLNTRYSTFLHSSLVGINCGG